MNPVLSEDTYSSTNESSRSVASRSPANVPVETESVYYDPLIDLDTLEATIVQAPHVPLTGKIMVEAEFVLSLLDSIRGGLPHTLEQAGEIVRQQNEIVRIAQQESDSILADARSRAYHIASELGIVERAQREAAEIRQSAVREAESLREKVRQDTLQLRQSAIDEVEQLRRHVESDCASTQAGADAYADNVLNNMESQLNDMLSAIRRGRQLLNAEAATWSSSRSTSGEN
jgi:vacuolar-type H+-ATPase subunit H